MADRKPVTMPFVNAKSPPDASTPSRSQSSTRGALILMVGTLASRISGLVRSALLTRFFSDGMTDAFWVAWRVPNLFRELLAEGALMNSFLPAYARLDAEEARRLSGAMLAVLLLVNSLLVALALTAAPQIVALLISAQANVDTALAIELTRLMFPLLMMLSFSALAMGILNAEEHFFAPAWAPVALNGVVILGVLLFPRNVHMLALSVVIGGLAQFLVQLPAIARFGLWPRRAWWHPALGGVLLLMLPFAFSTSARQFLNVITTRLLSNAQLFATGSVSAYEHANLILSLALGLFGVSPALAYYARLSHNAKHNPEQFTPTLEQGLRFIAFLSVPVGLLIFVLADPIMQVIWGWGKLEQGQAAVVSASVITVAPLGLALYPLSTINLLLRPFYIRERVILPVMITALAVGFTCLLYSVLAPRLGLAGLSWSTTAVAWLQMVILLNMMRTREKLRLTALTRHSVRVWCVAGIAAGLAWLFLYHVPLGNTRFIDVLSRLVLAGGVAGLSYAGGCWLLSLPEWQALLSQLKRKSQKH